MRLVANELLGNKLKVEFASLRILGKGYLTAPIVKFNYIDLRFNLCSALLAALH